MTPRPTLDADQLQLAGVERAVPEVAASGGSPFRPQVDLSAAPLLVEDEPADPLAGIDLGERPRDPWLAPVDPYARPEATDEALEEWYRGADIGHLIRQELRLRRIVQDDLEPFELTPLQAAQVAELREAGPGLKTERDWLAVRIWNLQQAEPDGGRWIAPQPLQTFAVQVREADHERLLELLWRLNRQLLTEREHAVEVLLSTGRFTRRVQDQAMVFG